MKVFLFCFFGGLEFCVCFLIKIMNLFQMKCINETVEPQPLARINWSHVRWMKFASAIVSSNSEWKRQDAIPPMSHMLRTIYRVERNRRLSMRSYFSLPLHFEMEWRLQVRQGWQKTRNFEKKTDKTRVFSNKPVFSLGFFKAGFFQINQYTSIWNEGIIHY